MRAYHRISMDELRQEKDAYEAKVREAEEEVAQLGFLREAIFRQPVVWGDHDQFQHGTLHILMQSIMHTISGGSSRRVCNGLSGSHSH